MKYFFKFFIIITRNGNLIPNVFFGSAGQVMYVVLGESRKIRHNIINTVEKLTGSECLY